MSGETALATKPQGTETAKDVLYALGLVVGLGTTAISLYAIWKKYNPPPPSG